MGQIAHVTLEYELPVTESGVVQGQTIWCPACRAPIVHRVAVGGRGLAMEYHCTNTGCPNHRRSAARPIRLRVEVEAEQAGRPPAISI